MLPSPGHTDIPEPTISSNVSEISFFRICRPEKYTLPWMLRYSAAKTGPVLVVLSGNKCFHLIQICLLHSCQFTDFMDPIALEFFGRCFVIHIGKVQTVGIPTLSKTCNQCTFADSLGSIQNQHEIEFDSGLIDSTIRCTERFSGDCPNVRIVFCTEIIDQERFNPCLSVPWRQLFKHLTNRMVTAVIRNLGNRNLIVPFRK